MKAQMMGLISGALIMASAPLLALPGDTDPAFNANVTAASVWAAAPQPDGKIVLVGDFTQVGGQTRNRVARVNADGSLDVGFNPNANALVTCVAVQADGKIVIGGQFSTVGGLTRNNIARLNSDGTVEGTGTFNPGTGASAEVDGVLVQPDGRIIITGFFTAVNGLTRNRIARLHANGSVEDTSTFNPGTGAANSILSAALQTDGKILVGGFFTTFNGATRTNIARLNADGTLENTATFNTTLNGAVYSIAVQPDGRIWLGGDFVTVNGVTINRLVRLNSNGSTAAPALTGSPAVIRAIALQTDGKVLIGGDFTALNGQARGRIARLGADGGLEGTGTFSTGAGADNIVRGITVMPDGRILVSGGYTNFASSGSRPRITMLANDSATVALAIPTPALAQWTRNGAGPEILAATFELSTDVGVTYTPLGNGTRTVNGWDMSGLSLTGSGQIRARGRITAGHADGSAGIVESVQTFAFAPEIVVESPPGTNLVDGAAGIDFGSVSQPGSSAPRFLTITNTGNADLILGAITNDGANPGDFNVTAPGSTTVAPSTSTTISVTFSPTATGVRSAILHLASNDANENPFDITLSGTGVSSDANLSGLALSSGTLSPSFDDGTVSYTASVSNATTSVTVTPTASNASATITVNGNPVNSGIPSGPINLNVGGNLITLFVTAQDLVTTKTYSLNVNRDSPSNGSTVVNINFDNIAVGPQAPDFLAAYGIPSVTFSGAPLSQGPYVTATLGNSVAPSPPNILYQAAGANEQNQPHILTFNFTPQLSAFSLDRVGKTGGGSTDTWHADFYNASGVMIGTMGEPSSHPINAPVTTFSFTAPQGQTIARMDLVSVWTGFATNATIPVDNFVLTQVPTSVVIDFDNMQEGPKAPDFLAAYGIPSVTFSGAPQSLGPAVTSVLGNSVAPSPPNILYQAAGANEQGLPHILIFNFNPRLTAFSLDRVGKVAGGSTDTWHADFYNAAGTFLGSFGESSPMYMAPVTTFSFTAPQGQTIARMDLVSVWTGFATNATIPVDNFVLTPSQTPPSTNADLSSLALSAGTLSPAFVSGTTSYAASVSNATTSLTVTPTVADSNATVTVSGISVNSGTASGPVALNVGSNSIPIVVTPQSGPTKTYTVVVTRAPSTNANLGNLQLNTATLSPVFSSGTLSYTASVPNATASLTVTPTVQDSTATVKVNNVTVASGSASSTINLAVGNNTITTVAKAQDGVTTKTYTVVVTRAPSSNANLANLTQSTGTYTPVFATGTIGYASTVAYPVATIRVIPTVQDTTATVKVNGVTVASGSLSGNINLNVGPNTITIFVKAQDGTTTKTYTLTVTRSAPSTNANLGNLALSAATLSPSFATSTSSYTASVAHLTTSTTLTATVEDNTATVRVNGAAVSSGIPSGAIALSVGVNTLAVVVTAEDGVTKKNYTVDVTRAPLVAVWNSAADIPLTIGTYAASGAVSMTLNFAPQTGTTLTVVKNTGLPFISGRFTNLAQGQAVTLNYNGIDYDFVANYYGGTGNDLVLQWANLRPMAWGSGIWGTLGNGSTFSNPLPVDVNLTGTLSEKFVVSAAVGASHSLALCSDGTIASWGDNAFGQLGDNTNTQRLTPVAVNTSGALSGRTVIAIAVGGQHTLALCSDGTLASWGDNGFGQLGDNTTTQRKSPVAVSTVGVLSGRSVVAVAAGQYHSLALCSDGTVVAWGANFHGQIGDGTTVQRKVPVAINGTLSGKTVIALCAGQFHNLALCSDGALAAWGANFTGELGDNTTTQRNAPVAVITGGTPLAGRTVIALAAGGFGHSLALCSDGTLAAWGLNSNGQLGDNSTTQRNVPVAVYTAGALTGMTVVEISAGSSHSLARCSDGTAFAWGGNNNGELGNNAFSGSQVPVAVNMANLNPGEQFTRASTGGSAFHNLAIVAYAAPTGPIPIVTTLAATSVTSTTATLNGTVNANGSSTAVSFDYGLTAVYGTNASATPATVTGSSAAAVSASLTVLQPGTTYHFRVKGVNGNGTRRGSDLSFTTPSNNASLSDLAISSGPLSPVFSSDTTSYGVIVSNATLSVNVTPTVAESHATVTVSGNAVPSGTTSGAITLSVGDNPIDTVVTAEDGTTARTYTIIVTRLPISNNANLAGLSLSRGTLSPVFAGNTTSYTASVSTAVTSLTVTPAAADSAATVKVNSVTVDPGDASNPISLSAGANAISIEVTAENGTTTKTYTIEVTRGVPSTNANLANLSLSAGILAPAFSSGNTDYTSTVVYESSSITVTPTVADGTAAVTVNDAPVASGTPSAAISLDVGDNTITILVTAEDGSTTKNYLLHVTRLPMEFRWGGATGAWSEAPKWAQLQAPAIGGEPPLGSGTAPMILHFFNNPVPVNATTPGTYTAINDLGRTSGQNMGFFALSKLILDGGPTGASGGGTSIIGSPTPGSGDPNLFFLNGGSIVNETSNGVGYTIQNYVTVDTNLTLSGNGTQIVKLGGILQPNLFVQPWTFPAYLHVTKVGASTFELPSAQTNTTTYDLREGALQTVPGTITSGPIILGHADSTNAGLKIGTNTTLGGGLADTADITVVAGPPDSTRTIQSLSTALNESVNLAGDLIIQAGASVRMDTGSSVDSLMTLGSNGSVLSGAGDLIVCGSGKFSISPLVNNSGFTGRIIVESGLYQAPPAIPGGGGFIPAPTTVGGGEMSFTQANGNYTQDIVVIPPLIGEPPPAFNVTDSGILSGGLTMNGGVDMVVANGKNFVFDGGLSGVIPAGQSLNLNATGTSVIGFSGDNSGLTGVIDFGRDVGTAGEAATLLMTDPAALPETVALNVYAGKVILAPPVDATVSGSIEFKAAAPGAAPPELVLLNETPQVPLSITLDGALVYNRETLIAIDAPSDQLAISGSITSSVPTAGIEKTGPGTLILNALGNGLPPDNFTAPTNVLEGTLKVNRDISGSDLSVAGGATLGGSGAVGDLTVLPGAIIAPGNSPGTLTTTSANLTGGTLTVEINGAIADKLVSTGPLTLTGSTLTVTVLAGGFTQPSYVIAQGNPLIGTFATMPGGYTVTYSPTQAILSQTAAPNPYNTWIDAYNSPPLSAADKLPTADPDLDGISNLLEFVLGSNPVVYSREMLPTPGLDGDNFVFSMKRRDASEQFSELKLEMSTDLLDWTTLPPITIGQASSGGVAVAENGSDDDDITVTIPLGASEFKFFRLSVISSGP